MVSLTEVSLYFEPLGRDKLECKPGSDKFKLNFNYKLIEYNWIYLLT